MKLGSKIIDLLKYLIAFCNYKLFFATKANDVWFIGERLGNTANDNGFYFFKYLMDENKHNGNVYFLYSNSSLLTNELSEYKENCIKLNSLRHYMMYFRSQYLVVAHGARDVIPTLIYYKFKSTIKPIIYLQHGVIKFKRLHFTKISYSKSIIRFLVSNKDEKAIVCDQLMTKKDEHAAKFIKFKIASYLEMTKHAVDQETSQLKDYIDLYSYHERNEQQLKYLEQKSGFTPAQVPVTGLARHDALIARNNLTAPEKVVLIFPTWRDELRKVNQIEFQESDYYQYYNELINDPALLELVQQNNYKIKFHLHPEMMPYIHLFESKHNTVEFVKDDVFELILKSEILITDYSSLSWDFDILNKNIIFYHFDKSHFDLKRSGYCHSDADWPGDICLDINELRSSLSSNLNKYNHQIIEREGKDLFCQQIFSEIQSIPKKVYFLVYNIYGIGGTVKTITNTANYLYSKGYIVEVISVKKTKVKPDLGLNPGIKISSLFDSRNKGSRYKVKNNSLLKAFKGIPVRILSRFNSRLIDKSEDLYPMFSLFTDLQLIRKLQSLNNSILVTTIPSFNLIAPKLVNKTVKVIGQEHKFFDAHSDELKSKIKSGYSKLDHLTVLTNDDLDTYSTMLDPKVISVQANGTDLLANKPEFKAENSKRFISLARFVDQKRLDLLIDAFKLVCDKDPECTLDIYGQGKLKTALLERIENHNLSKNVFIYEPITDIYSVLPNYSAFLLSSGFEPFGMVIIEAYACGVPVISFDISYGPKTLIEDGVTGLKSPAFDVDAYAQSILQISADINLRNTLSDNCYKLCSTKYSNEAVGNEFVAILDKFNKGN